MNYTEVLYKKYNEEMKFLIDFPIMGIKLFEKYLLKKLKDMKHINILQESTLQGISFYECWEDKGIRHDYRGAGLARELLQYAQARAKHEGAEYMWVEHGTANPNARGFWNKYFSTYEYELVRTIN